MDQEQAFQAAVEKGAFAGMNMPPRVVELPWLDKVLSPNSRVHWAYRARRVRAARDLAGWGTKAIIPHWRHNEGARLSVTFFPPDRRRRDDDNAIGAFKAYRDGIADALGIDDHKFKCSYAFGEVVKGGSVRVEIRPIP